MALFIDPPRWPAHGTVFSHLISDASLAELHAFAAKIGIDRRAFDEDHYDLHVDKYDAALAAGAIPVSGRELIDVLRRSGLRIPAKERVAATLRPLRRRWEELGVGREDLREELLRRWMERHRWYHTPVHLLHCLESIDTLTTLAGLATASVEVRLAAWFHDSIYEGVPGGDEEASAELARQALGGDLGAEVARLVLLTRDHLTGPGDDDGEVLVDADLAILAERPYRYERYVRAVREEYANVPDNQWREGRGAVLRHLLQRPSLYMTRYARERWERAARLNLSTEMASLSE